MITMPLLDQQAYQEISLPLLTQNTMLRKLAISGIKRRAISSEPTAVSIVIVF
jgi:hypothetical protein